LTRQALIPYFRKPILRGQKTNRFGALQYGGGTLAAVQSSHFFQEIPAKCSYMPRAWITHVAPQDKGAPFPCGHAPFIFYLARMHFGSDLDSAHKKISALLTHKKNGTPWRPVFLLDELQLIVTSAA